MKKPIPLFLVVFLFGGSIICNRVTPLILGLPLFFVWTIFSVVLIFAMMWLVFLSDPQNKRQDTDHDGWLG
ncbi:DUF3311 domain-containing protein [Rhizobium sp. S163]|uniref:DUF3311 domain-containing protein n=1 Tax=Rhizobium sp. S163 TaxID=3055039 RepID=UPI0025A9ED48|nr:DUF3311 domain-containing protein [Rhizobium sp. S163]MDM9648687.1 DUF3311 domain-containing protein [Rhizobium sp. S163]